ncbi:hypothetical protein L249_5534, partial [Ophiocordyceps polyrhachis-furcata BCC 54312]
DEELTNREGDHVIEKKKRNHKVRKADANDSSKYVPYPAVSAVLRGVWVRIRPYL